MKKKILIMTLFHNNYNYGGILQAYALYTKLNEMEAECFELDYLSERTLVEKIVNNIKVLNERGIRGIINKRISQMKRSKAAKEYFYKYNGDPLRDAFEKFMKTEFRISKLYNRRTIKHIEEAYDISVVGGDQMWNPDWYDKNYYLAFSQARHNFAYSCSVGKDNITKEDEKKILSHLKKIDVISVRETTIKDWFQKKGYPVELICDPVFLFTKAEWSKLAYGIERYCKEDYIFAYIFGEDLDTRIQIRKLADDLGLKIVSIPNIWRRYNPNDEGFADFAPINVGPREFISIIKNAKYVLTDSFHGTAFSIIFEKDFYNFSRFKLNESDSQNSRLLSILGLFGLEDRYILSDAIRSIPRDFGKKIDYGPIEVILEAFRKKAEIFLKNQLDIN